MAVRLRLIALLALALVPLAPGFARAAETGPVIGPGDTLRLRVLEWRPAAGELTAWDAFDGEYVVAPDGRVTFPLVGPLPAAGRDTAAIGAEVEERLQEAAGLLNRPSAVLEVTEWRPVTVVGAVDAPGAFAYRPGLTVLQAVGLAGGLRRSADRFDRFEREAIAGRGDLRVLALELDALAARRARLRAEREDAETIAFPENLAQRAEDDPATAALLEEETMIFDARRESLAEEIAANERLQRLLAEQIAQLEEQTALKDRQLQSISEETERVRDLVERGLATATRLSDLERRLAGYESEAGDIIRSIIRAQVDLNRAERNVIALGATRRREVAQEIRDTQEKIAELRERYMTARAMVHEAEVIAPARSAARERERSYEPRYAIVRAVDGALSEISAEETTALAPGDTVRVVVPLPDIGVGFPGAEDPGVAPGGPAAAAPPLPPSAAAPRAAAAAAEGAVR